ncbi:MAG: glycoside hydrolase family 127 protein [Clostridia bacterium]|nr:glycoside hydrolase family 127 protein [Clostridia bacterium]
MVKKVIAEKDLKALNKTLELDMLFRGTLKESVEFIERNQLYDVSLWEKFVDVFRAHDDGRGDWYVTWRSEYWGKMMRGASMVTRYTGNKEIYRILENSIRDILDTEDEFGRISGYRVSEEFNFWDLWGRKYVMLGMMYFMEICEDDTLNEQMISSMCRQADYIIDRIGDGEGKLDICRCSKHWEGLNSCSILEPIVRLYRLTGNKKYFEFAKYIISTGFILSDNLIELAFNNVSPHDFPVVKAYEMMSCFEGLLQFYYITGNEHYKTALINFGKNIIDTEFSIIGCSGCTHELFDHTAIRQTQTDYEGIIQETCVTVTWMKFASQLLELTGDAKYADKIEQSFYNAYLGSFNTNRIISNDSRHKDNLGTFSAIMPFDSYSPLVSDTRGRQVGGYNLLLDNTYYGCCACIGAAGAGVIPEIALLNQKNGFVINYYEKGFINAVTPEKSPIKINIDTDYPYNGKVKFSLEMQKSEEFEITLRIPCWCDKASISFGGYIKDFTPGYATVKAIWNNGDEIILDMPMRVKRVMPPDGAVNRDIFSAYTYGPLVLAADKRLTDPDGVLAVKCDEAGFVDAKVVEYCPEIKEAHICFEVPLESGETAKLIDYASAGKTWDESSRCAAWLRIK